MPDTSAFRSGIRTLHACRSVSIIIQNEEHVKRYERQLKAVMSVENLNGMLDELWSMGKMHFHTRRPLCGWPRCATVEDLMQSFCERDVFFFDSVAVVVSCEIISDT